MSKGFDFNCMFSKLAKCSHLMYGISPRKSQRRKISAFFCRLPAAAIHGGRIAFERGSICGLQKKRSAKVPAEAGKGRWAQTFVYGAGVVFTVSP